MKGPRQPYSNDRIGGIYRYEIRLLRANGASLIFNVTVDSEGAAVERKAPIEQTWVRLSGGLERVAHSPARVTA